VPKGKAGQTVRIETQLKFPGQPVKNFQGSLFRVDIGSGRQDEKMSREKILGQARVSDTPSPKEIHSVLKDIDAGLELSGDHSSADRELQAPSHRHPPGQMQWWIKVNGLRDIHFRFPMVPGKYVVPMSEENVEQGIKSHNKHHGTVIWSLPPVILEDRWEWYSRATAALMHKGYNQFQIGHFSQLPLFPGMGKDQPQLLVYGDYTVNNLNSLSLTKMKDMGLAGTLFSIETDRENMAAALKGFQKQRREFLVGMYVYGRPPLFTARLDDPHFDFGKRFVSPKGEEYILSRGNEMTLARSVEPFSLLGEWKNLARLEIDYLLVDLSTGNLKRNVSELIAHYFRKGEPPPSMSGNYFATLA
jgi:putative protease